MRGSAATSRGQSQYIRGKEALTLTRTPSIRRELGDVMNVKPQPMYSPEPYRYMGSPRSPNYPPRGNPSFWNSRVANHPPAANGYNRPSLERKQSEPVAQRQMNTNHPEISRSQTNVLPPRDQSYKVDHKKLAQSNGPKNEAKPENVSSTSASRHIQTPESSRSPPLTSRIEPRNQTPPPESIQSSYGFKYSFRSKKGYNPSFNKQNQDACIVISNMNNRQWEHFFAICDGHGEHGHVVSSTLRSHFLQVMANSAEFYKKPNENLYMAFRSSLERCLRDGTDLSTSGSTMVSCYLSQNKLYCANVGDSRAIMGSRDPKTGKWSTRALSNDHKPSLPLEAQRIWKFNGRIDSMRDQFGKPIGPLRVWYQNQNFPGLAMTRSIGDLVAAQVGVTWQPQIIEHNIDQNDKILLIASDGVWEFLSNDQVISKMSAYYESNQIEEASKFLMEFATTSWTKNTTIIDDISFILVFLTHQ